VLPCVKTDLYPGWIINVTATVQDSGDFNESAINVTAFYSGNTIGREVISELVPVQKINVTFAWNTQGVAPGTYTMSANASRVPGETQHINNNTRIDGNVTLLVPTTQGVVALTGVTLKLPSGAVGIYAAPPPYWQIPINATFKNTGDYREIFNVSAYYGGNLIQTITLTLYPVQNKTITIIWNPAGDSPGNYTIKANATYPGTGAKVYGTLQVRLWGDVNGDGVVNIGDIIQVELACSGLITNPWADVNGDGQINISDVIMVELIASGIL
jgi:hypothetical protein